VGPCSAGSSFEFLERHHADVTDFFLSTPKQVRFSELALGQIPSRVFFKAPPFKTSHTIVNVIELVVHISFAFSIGDILGLGPLNYPLLGRRRAAAKIHHPPQPLS